MNPDIYNIIYSEERLKMKYEGTFWGRYTCYSITDVWTICPDCKKKIFVSRSSVIDCMRAWKKSHGITFKGINILCKRCGRKSLPVDTPEIIASIVSEG